MPDILENRGTRRDEIPLINIVLRNTLWESERQRASPSKKFLNQRRNIRQILLVRELWQTFASHNPVQFLLRLFHNVRVEGRNEEIGSQD